jgi:hypothetical protein
MVTMNACKVKVMRVESRSDNRTAQKHGTITHSHPHPNREIKVRRGFVALMLFVAQYG